MFRRRSHCVTLLVCAAATAGFFLSSQAAELYRRAVVLEDQIGRIDVRNAYGVRLSVLMDCEGNRGSCEEKRVYDEVIRLDFVSEQRTRRDESVVRAESPRGTIYLALRFSGEDLELFRSELESSLRRLSAEAFVEPFAGWGWDKPPLNTSTLSPRSVLPSWACYRARERSEVARFHREVEEGVVLSAGSQTYREPPTAVCDEMATATEGALPRVIETLPSPRRLLEFVVEHEDVIRIDSERPEALMIRPEGIHLFKRKAPEGISGEGAGESFAQYMAGGWRFDGYAQPARVPIEALDRDAWLHAFTIRSVERRFGPNPVEQVLEESTLSVAYLATTPASLVEDGSEVGGITISSEAPPLPASRQPPPQKPAAIHRSEFLETVESRLDRHGGPPQEIVEEIAQRPAAGLETEGWIVVLCWDDGTATYYLPPTKAHNRVTNSALFCAALETRLRRGR